MRIHLRPTLRHLSNPSPGGSVHTILLNEVNGVPFIELLVVDVMPYLGDERTGGKPGRGSEKIPFVAAVKMCDSAAR